MRIEIYCCSKIYNRQSRTDRRKILQKFPTMFEIEKMQLMILKLSHKNVAYN